MRYLIAGILLLLGSIYLGIEIAKANSYVLIVINHWVVESSLWVATVVVIIVFIILYFLLRLLGKVLGISKRYQRWRNSHRHRKAHTLTRHGLCELAEGYWEKAEETLLKAARLSKQPLIDYLAAAKAAQAQQAYDRRDAYLRRAILADKGAIVAVSLTQAQLQIDSQQWEQALATLQRLDQIEPHHNLTIKLLSEVYINLNEWEKLQALLKPIKKYKAIPQKQLHSLEHLVYQNLLALSAEKTPEHLNLVWKSLSREDKHDIEFIREYIKALLKLKQDASAQQVIEHSLKKQWDETLVTYYEKICGQNTSKQLEHAEQWYKKHGNSCALLICLGQLCIRERQWGNAKEYLEQHIQIKPTPKAFLLLAEVFGHLSQHNEADKYYRLAAKGPTIP